MAVAAGCAASKQPIEFKPQQIERGRWVPRVERFVVILDDSRSMLERAPDEKKLAIATHLAKSLSQTIPAFDYHAGLRAFGQGKCIGEGTTSLVTNMAKYSSSEFGSGLGKFTCANGDSPLDEALTASGADLGAAQGGVAIIVISDGLHMGETEIEAGQALAEKFGDRLCIHTIQIGDDSRGTALLDDLAKTTQCGGAVNASALTGAGMAKLVQDALLYPDADGDGVADHMDKCPNTPAGTKVDKSGCPLDSDGDGVSDGSDKCPNTPSGVKVDATGCPVDSDGDGVPDPLDKCPNTPAGTKVDKDGCPIDADSDGDGVRDSLDKCPGTPRNVPVREDGCPPDGMQLVDGEWVIQGRLLFDTNKWELKPEALALVDRMVDYLKRNQQWAVEIQGHTDSTGSRELNMSLSQRRADAVGDYLRKQGIDASRVTTKGYGPDEPMGSNATPEGRQQNRRVDVKPIER